MRAVARNGTSCSHDRFGAILGMIIPPGDNQHSVEQIYSCQEGDNLLYMDILEQE